MARPRVSGGALLAEPIGERFETIGTYELDRVACNLVNGLPPR